MKKTLHQQITDTTALLYRTLGEALKSQPAAAREVKEAIAALDRAQALLPPPAPAPEQTPSVYLRVRPLPTWRIAGARPRRPSGSTGA